MDSTEIILLVEKCIWKQQTEIPLFMYVPLEHIILKQDSRVELNV